MHYYELNQIRAELTAPGAPFEIETIRANGTTVKAYKNMPANLREVWHSTANFGDRDYLVYNNERITFRQAHRLCRNIACWLADQGVDTGDRVAIAMRNYPEWMLIYWACVSSGITVVGLNAWWADAEVEQALANSRPKVIFADRERITQLLQCTLPTETVTCVAVRTERDPTPELKTDFVSWQVLTSYQGVPPNSEIDPDTTACLFYTSGTSGPPKGAELTHLSAVCNIYNVLFAGQCQQLAIRRARGLSEIDEPTTTVALLTTPLFHVTANNCAAQIATVLGGTIVLMYRWDAGTALKLIVSERVTTISGVPLMVRELVDHPNFLTTDTSSLLRIGGGGAPLPPDLLGKIKHTSPNLSTSSGYGMTEASGLVASISDDFFIDNPTSCGPVLPTFDAICVDDNGQPVASGSIGELWIKGASIIKGYFDNPQASAEVITDGWLHTGDLAHIDENGFLHIVDRKKDMILRGGENIFCAEVEAALYRHPAVAECCVFAVPNPRYGEAVGAAVLLKQDTQLARQDLQQHCAEFLANYKIPESIWLLSEPIPRNASGKFLKKELMKKLEVG